MRVRLFFLTYFIVTMPLRPVLKALQLYNFVYIYG